MPHILNRVKDANIEEVKSQLSRDADAHAAQGIFLEHLWQNHDDPSEALFLFRVDDLSHCKRLIERRYADMREHDPSANLPETMFLYDQA